jgi:hypothetical protein
MCIMAPVLPIRLDGTSARYKASDLHEGVRCQLPGIRIEPKVNNTLRGMPDTGALPACSSLEALLAIFRLI